MSCMELLWQKEFEPSCSLQGKDAADIKHLGYQHGCFVEINPLTDV